MTTDLDPGKIAQLLTLSTQQLDQSTLSALHNARQSALNRQAVRAPAFAFITDRGTLSLIPNSIQQWVFAGLLIVMLVIGTSYWQHVQEQQISDIDVAILPDDLPIEVFVD